jgi:hypothetical protein
MEGAQEQHENSDSAVPEQPVRGRPFQPGQSGNPGGRPRGSKSLVNLLIEALRKRAKDGKGGEKEFYELLAESIVVNAAKGNAALVKLIFDYHEGPPPQKHEVTGIMYDGTDLQQLLRQIGELMRDFVPPERWEEFGARLDELDAADAA